MSSFAIVPWSLDYSNDKIFEIGLELNNDNALEPYAEMRCEFEKRGHIIHTLDKYDDYMEVDYFLFFTLDWHVVRQLIRIKKTDRMVYCTAEPPSVCNFNTPKGYRVLRYVFPYILTWNHNWVDNKYVFRRNIPYHFIDQRSADGSFEKKKLLTCISGNKHSAYPGELYSEREKAILFFEENHPDEFVFYGKGWDKEIHPCYGGAVDKKADVYQKYRFALCYENIEGMNGYVTEKMPDCLVNGIVPIYAGSVDVDDYIPRECYIRLRDFNNYVELYEYLKTMDTSTYSNYLNNADLFLKSDKSDYFSGAKYAQYILEAISHKKPFFKTSVVAYKLVKLFLERQ